MNEWNDIAVLTPPGDIDIATVPALRRRLDALIGRGVRRVVINCQAVSFIDSTGLAFLLTRARELMRREGLLSLVNAYPSCRGAGTGVYSRHSGGGAASLE